jgi:acetyl-CoA acetyltransferase family protein
LSNPLIIDAVRTPLGKRKGQFRDIQPIELASFVLEKLVERSGIDPAMVEDVIIGCVTQTGEQGANIARLSSLLAGFPPSVPAVSINRMCGSSQQAVHFAAQAILAGDMDLVIAGGVESMTRVPLGSDYAPFHPDLASRYGLVHQGISAEMIAEKWSVYRDELDRYSLESHHKAFAATEEGFFEKEILPFKLGTDEGIRPDTTMEQLASLKPAFRKDGVVTAGNSSQLTDGAAALLISSESKAKELGLKGRAKILHRVVVGSDPVIMLDGIIPATRKILDISGLSLSRMDWMEVNEAFASVVLAWQKELDPQMDRVNPWGGAIALGHPVGASGARIMTTLVNGLEATGGTLGLQTMCIGHGMGTATIIERI